MGRRSSTFVRARCLLVDPHRWLSPLRRPSALLQRVEPTAPRDALSHAELVSLNAPFDALRQA